MTFVSDIEPTSWTIVQITDTHLMNQVNLEFVNINPEHRFHQIMVDIQQTIPAIDAIIHTGDLAQVPSVETYQRYLHTMQLMKLPHFQIPGNHDDAEIFPFYQGKNQAHIIHFGPWSIVLLNSAVPGKVDGWVNQAQLQQLDDYLTTFPHQFFLIACHHHPFEMQSKWIDHHRLKNSEDFKKILAKHHNVKVVLYGHVHQDSFNEWNNIHFLSTPATSVQFKPRSEHFALDPIAPGYRVIQLKENGEFETNVHRVQLTEQEINIEISGY